MAFLITTSAEITLTDLGNRVFAAGTTNFNLESEYHIEEIRYSESLASAIFSGEATAVDDFGRNITSQSTLAETQELLKLSFHIDNTDALVEGTTNKYYTDERSRSAISVEGSEQNLTYNSTTGELNFADGPTFPGNVVVQGNLDVQGTTTTVDSEDLLVKDNVITVNAGESGAGVTLGQAGIKVDRGTEDPFVFVFDEGSDTFRVGEALELTDGSFAPAELQAVATREDNPTIDGLAFWNNTESRFDTDSSLHWDIDTEYLHIGSEFVSATKIAAWDSMASGGITSVTAGNGLTSTGTNDVVLNVGAGTGITVNADDIAVNVDDSSIEVNASDNLGIVSSGVTEVHLNASVAGTGLTGGDGTALSVSVDDVTIEVTTNTLNVKTNSIDENYLTESVAGSGLTGGNGTALSVNVDSSTISIETDVIKVSDGGITETQLNTSVAGTGLAGGGGTALSVNVDDLTIEVNGSDNLQIKTDGINDTHINWGINSNEVNAADMPIVDTGDNFVSTNVEDTLLEIYNNAGAKYLEDLLDVDMPTGTLGGNDVLKYNDSTGQWEPGSISKTWSFSAVSNAKKTTNRYLDRQDGLATNLTPYISFYTAFIRKIVINSNSASTWTAEIRVNGTTTASLASGGAKSAVSTDLEVSITAGDEISIYVSGSGINRPSVDVLFEEDIF